MKDDSTLRQQNITKNSKVMLVGSKLNDVMAVNVVSEEEKKKLAQEDKPMKESLSKTKVQRLGSMVDWGTMRSYIFASFC